MNRPRKWTVDALRKAVAENASMAASLRKLGLVPIGGNYLTIHYHIRRLGLDTSHWLGMGHRKGSKTPVPGTYRSLEEILVENSPHLSTSKLKQRLLRVGLLENRCVECGLTEWCGRPLVMHFDHINGLDDDHRLENLRMLCPSCHSQTATYCGRNMARAILQRQRRRTVSEAWPGWRKRQDAFPLKGNGRKAMWVRIPPRALAPNDAGVRFG
jgi:hypothetical protein